MGKGEKCPCEKGKSYLSEKSGQRSSIHSLCAMQATDAFIQHLPNTTRSFLGVRDRMVS